MADIGVWSEKSDLVQLLTARLGSRHRFQSGDHPSVFALHPPRLLVIAPDARALAGASAIPIPLALIPGRAGWLFRSVRALSAVSYGLGAKNTLTFSSLEQSSVSLALQRDLVTLGGNRLEAQEWVLPRPDTLTPEEFLCLQGALLLLDVLPEGST